MKRANQLQLSAMLHADADANALQPDDADIVDDAHIEQLARQQELSRKAFDDVLSHSAQYWRSQTDPHVLSDALATVLDHIRGATPISQSPSIPDRTAHPRTAHVTQSSKLPSADDDNDPEMEKFADATDVPLHQPQQAHPDSFRPRAKYIPLRLSQTERKLLRLVEAALMVSEYTDVVDVLGSRQRPRQRIHTQIRDLCSILTGLTVAMDYAKGQKLVADHDFAHNEAFFQNAFEIARRHKIANPEKSRNTYGKLIHMLQDSAQKEIIALLDFSCVKPLVTVASYLEQRGGLALLDDPLMATATKEIIPDNKPRRLIQREISEKERAVNTLAKRYQSRVLGDEEIRRCLYSIGDNSAYLRCARDPCDAMIKYLHQYFTPEAPKDRENSLSIASGSGGARLTHDHNRQFRYVFQSLALWREVCHEMFKLWYLSETDLLNSENPYSLRNTGQGLNRLQTAPSVKRAMNEILTTVQRRVGSWVGSSVIHLGDFNVPNALVFIDKYAQVQRILGPLCTCIRRLGDIAEENVNIKKYIHDAFGGIEPARKMILRDFFRHAFDGSGASDWFSAGSCIDGRLTSAWNWCSEIEKKTYWPLMLLTGFTGFDGDF